MFDSITVQTASESASIQTLIYTILLAFLLSTLLGIVYQKTAGDQNYSKTYLQTLILISLISAVIIQSIGDSLARGLGIMAAMAIIRFRTNLKDPRELLFLFASLAAGISCGTYAFDIAIVGTVGFSIAAFILYLSPLGPDKQFNGRLSFQISSNPKEKKYLDHVLQHFCTSFDLDALSSSGKASYRYVFMITLKKNKSYEEFLAALKKLPSIKKVNLKALTVK